MMPRPTWVLAAAALAGAASVSACFSSRQPLIGSAESAAVLGAGGLGKRVVFENMAAGAQAERISIAWIDNAYVIFDAKGRREKITYRFAALGGDWLIVQRMDRAVTDYGLARLDDERLWLYAPQCMALSDAERQTIGASLGPDGACFLASIEQLKAALSLVAGRRPSAIGYFEPLTPLTPPPKRP